ncbi:MAG: transcriptional regulator [Alphaproteobacteria bacterium]|nr:MAG: transcriptional regulator [Alphaproteobacteria bacterium]
MDDIFQALADRNRRLLLDRLRDRNGQTLRQLTEGQAMTRQAVSKHLAVLERANLVITERRGREKLHYINPVPVHQIACRWLNQFETMPLTALVNDLPA